MHEDRKKVCISCLQTRLFVRVALSWFVYQVCLWNLVFMWRLLVEKPDNALEQYGRYCLDYAPALLGSAALLPFVAWDAVRFFHRIIGPIQRFRLAMQAVVAGRQVEHVRLRRGDLLTDMRDDFNRMLDAVRVPGHVPSDAADPSSLDCESVQSEQSSASVGER